MWGLVFVAVERLMGMGSLNACTSRLLSDLS